MNALNTLVKIDFKIGFNIRFKNMLFTKNSLYM